MWKSFSMTAVACGLMLGVAGFADAGTVPLKNTTAVALQRTSMRPQKKTTRVHQSLMHRRSASKNTTVGTSIARRGYRGHHHYHHRHHMMYRMS